MRIFNDNMFENINDVFISNNFDEIFSQEQFYSIAVFDILGFSNYISENGNKTILNLYRRLLNLAYKPDILRMAPVPLSKDWKYSTYALNVNGYVRTAHFSDTFIIYVNYISNRSDSCYLNNQKYEEYPLLLFEELAKIFVPFLFNHSIFLTFLHTCMEFFCNAVVEGIPLRGCVSFGKATMDSSNDIYFGESLVEAARGEPSRKSLNISFGKSFNNYHPIYNDYFIPMFDYIKNDSKANFLSPMILDWPRFWDELPIFQKYSFEDCIRKMDSNPNFSEYYDNAIQMYKFSKKHRNWSKEINRDNLKNIVVFYDVGREWYNLVK